MPITQLHNPEIAHGAPPLPASASPRVYAALLLTFAALLAAVVMLRQPITTPQPGYFADVQAWSPSTPIADSFTPLAYPLLLAPAYRVAGTGGILAVQSALYLATVGVAFLLLLQLEVSPRIAALGTLLVLLHPELFLSIAKIWDVGLSSFLFLLLALGCLRLMRVGGSLGMCLALGTIFGITVFCRPNFALLLPVVGFAFSRARVRIPIARATGAALMAVATFALAGVAAHGKPFWPGNGPYNLYAGNNPLSADTLLTRLNAEPSIDPAFRAAHANLVPTNATESFYYSPWLQPIYSHDATIFAFRHPIEQARLVAIKLFTLFRPDTKLHPLRSAAGAIEALLALPAPLFLVALLAKRRPPFTTNDHLMLALVAAYVVPFLLTNSDPRFRTPLDALLLLFTVSLAFARSNRFA